MNEIQAVSRDPEKCLPELVQHFSSISQAVVGEIVFYPVKEVIAAIALEVWTGTTPEGLAQGCTRRCVW